MQGFDEATRDIMAKFGQRVNPHFTAADHDHMYALTEAISAIKAELNKRMPLEASQETAADLVSYHEQTGLLNPGDWNAAIKETRQALNLTGEDK